MAVPDTTDGSAPIDPVVVQLSDNESDHEVVIQEPQTPCPKSANGHASEGLKGKVQKTNASVKLTDFSPEAVNKYYSELADLIGEASDIDVHGASDDSDYQHAGIDSADDDYLEPDASEEDKPKNRKRKASRSPFKTVPSPPKKPKGGGMRTRITDRIIATPKPVRKSRYQELKDAFGITEQEKGNKNRFKR